MDYAGDTLTESVKSPDYLRMPSRSGSGMPVKVNRSSWEVLKQPNRFQKNFQFLDVGQVGQFVMNILEFEAETCHYGRITVEGLSVTILVWTRDLEDITESDREYCRMVDLIHTDTMSFHLAEG